jgi:hypothetical protein
MKKPIKILSTVVIFTMMFSITVFAEISLLTVVIGDKAFSLK